MADLVATEDLSLDIPKDEYEVSLGEGVDDEALLEKPDVQKFVINSYGADYTVDSLVKRMNGNAFVVPDFQRQFIWTLKHSSKFIESLLMGLPVPGIFLYKNAGSNTHLVIDGQQRLKTLQAYFNGVLNDKVFRLTGVRDPWNNKSYADLDQSDVLKLDDSIVHATIFQQDEPKNVLDSIYFVFERINSGGIRLSPQEIRNCISRGRFTQKVKELNQDLTWRKLFGPYNNRSKDEELIIRFVALYVDGDVYARPMVKFLNDFSAKMNEADEQTLSELAGVFINTVEKVFAAIGSRAFRLVRALNAAVFDSVMVGLAKRLATGVAAEDARIATAYDRLLQNQKYRQACEQATADEENVQERQRLALEAFLEV